MQLEKLVPSFKQDKSSVDSVQQITQPQNNSVHNNDMHVNWLDKNILYFLDYSIEPSTSHDGKTRHSHPRDLKRQTILGFVGTPFLEKGIQGSSLFSFQVTLVLFVLW